MTRTDQQDHLDQLDMATIDLIFALRDSLTDVSRLDFWSGRVTTALETAAAGADHAAQAITIACRKLQIPTIRHTSIVVAAAKVIDRDYQAWAQHISRTIVYIVALASTQRDARKTTTDRSVPA